MQILPLLKESVRSGTIASLVMMPIGLLFQHLGLRVGHYGPKLATLLFGDTSPLLLFFAEPTPWQLGFDFIYPSLLVHVAFGASIGFTAGRFVAREAGQAST